MKVRISRVDPALPLPAYHTAGAVAFDIYSREDAVVPPHECMLVPTNLVIEVPEGYALIVAPRSGLFKKGLTGRNGIGVIDQDYHGPDDEVRLVLYNFTDAPVPVTRGDRLAQGFIVPIEKAEWEEVPRGARKSDSRGGFGSTG